MFLKTWSDIGGAAAAPPCCANVDAPSQHTMASATRTVYRLFTAGLLLDRLRGVGTARAEERLHVALLHDRLQRSAALDHLAREALEDHHVAGPEVVGTPALAANRVRTRQLHVPVGDLAVLVLHVDVDAHVRVGPGHLRDGPFELHLLLGVVLGVEAVVRENRTRDADDGDRRGKNAERPHCYFLPSVPVPIWMF